MSSVFKYLLTWWKSLFYHSCMMMILSAHIRRKGLRKIMNDQDTKSSHQLNFKCSVIGPYILCYRWMADFVKRLKLQRWDMIGLGWNLLFSRFEIFFFFLFYFLILRSSTTCHNNFLIAHFTLWTHQKLIHVHNISSTHPLHLYHLLCITYHQLINFHLYHLLWKPTRHLHNVFIWQRMNNLLYT